MIEVNRIPGGVEEKFNDPIDYPGDPGTLGQIHRALLSETFLPEFAQNGIQPELLAEFIGARVEVFDAGAYTILLEVLEKCRRWPGWADLEDTALAD